MAPAAARRRLVGCAAGGSCAGAFAAPWALSEASAGAPRLPAFAAASGSRPATPEQDCLRLRR
eukprot:5539006-Heterocapsa_arctica.AAC.1